MNALIAAHRAGIDLDFDKAAAIDLAGRDVLDAVRTSVHPKVIDCPDARYSGSNTLAAIARDGVELKVMARVTVRTNLDQLIGGATEETVIARVGESIISSIGSSENHLVVLENPNLITRTAAEAAPTTKARPYTRPAASPMPARPPVCCRSALR